MILKLSATTLVLMCAVWIPARAASIDERIPDQQSLDALETRANAAQPREQCYLYAQLVHHLTEFSLRQYASGDTEKGQYLLMHIQQLASKIHFAVADNDKRLKDTEILLRHTAFRLSELLHGNGAQDSSLVGATLAQVNQAQNETMIQVFRK